jgi:hypothetical protein
LRLYLKYFKDKNMPPTEKSTINQKLDRVLYILENDEKTNRKGLVEDVADMKLNLEELILKQKIFAAKVAFLGVIGGFIFSFCVWAFDKITIK